MLVQFETPRMSDKERERAEDYAKSQVKYAKKLIDDGEEKDARERLLKVWNEYRYTAAASEAKKVLREIGK